jgi:hypothetical protein
LGSALGADAEAQGTHSFSAGVPKAGCAMSSVTPPPDRVEDTELRGWAVRRTPSHLDGHQHTHLLPPLWRLRLELVREYGIPWVGMAACTSPFAARRSPADPDGMDSSRDLNGINVPKSTLSVEGGVEMDHTTIEVDVAKSVFEVAVSEHPGRLRERSSVIARPISPVPRRAVAGDRRHGGV